MVFIKPFRRFMVYRAADGRPRGGSGITNFQNRMRCNGLQIFCIKLILSPFGRVVFNIICFCQIIVFISYNMVIEALLPYGIPRLFRNISLELVHDSRQCGRGRRLPGVPYFDDKMNVC